MKTVRELVNSKSLTKISMITCYDYSTAKIIKDTDIDIVLVGDSLGMVIYGYPSTLQVEMEQMVFHTEAVYRGLEGQKLLVSDLPFLSYQTSTRDAVFNAGRLLKAGANIVKLEGGKRVIDKVRAIVDADIPVMGHLGLTPQSINVTGGYKLQAVDEESIENLFEDAFALQNEGVVALVLELVPEEVAKKLTEELSIPTIGIGSGRFCDGQVLVINDMLGWFKDFSPKHTKKYANLSEVIFSAVNEYVSDVKNGTFPGEGNVFHLKKEVDFEKIIRKFKVS
jgi:3-methyl-2-oxobutanoate hydroxymethyltransferase